LQYKGVFNDSPTGRCTSQVSEAHLGKTEGLAAKPYDYQLGGGREKFRGGRKARPQNLGGTERINIGLLKVKDMYI
jgi:hypothetical protein